MKKLILLPLIISLLLLACSNSPKRPELKPPYILANLQSMPIDGIEFILTRQIDGTNLEQTGEIKIIRPMDSLNNIGGQRELLLNHLFVGLFSTVYQNETEKIYVELIKFADNINSYGYYAMSRPTAITNEKIGAEAYKTGNSFYLVKNEYLITLSLETDSPDGQKLLTATAKILNDNIPGSNTAPNFYKLFPYGNIIYPSGEYHPYQYLNLPGLDQVYTTKYLIEDDTLLLFLTMDDSGDKFFFLSDFANANSIKSVPVNQFPYDSSKSIAYEIDGLGVIVGGLVKNKLVGAIGYNPKKHEAHLRKWLLGFK